MTGHRKLKLQVKVSASPTGASRQNLPFPSTILTSPISESRRRGLRAKQRDQDDEMEGYADDFVEPDSEDEEEYFEPVLPRGKQREATPAGLGPPVTTDERMEALPELHRVFVCQFVEEAKKEVDRIKNDRNLARLFFTEANLREMAISWTVTLQDMQEIPGINVDAVKKWGRYIIPIVARYSKNYDDAMNGREDRDIDKNHQNVIDLCSDDDDEEYGLNDSEEEAILQAEQQGSKYFQNPTGPTSGGQGRRMPRQTVSRGSSAAPRKNYRGANSQYRNRSRRGGSRRSGGSISGQSSSGVSRRKLIGGAKRSGPSTASTSTALKSTDLFKKFGHQGNSRGGGGGGMGGGIGMMPV
jgi:bloom syndrome protein